MGLIGRIESGLVHVKGVGILHHELTTAQQAGPRPGLVTVLDLDLVQEQRQVFVRVAEVFDHEGEHLLMGGAEQHVGALAVDEPEQVVAVFGPPVGGFVRLARQQTRKAHLLGADGVHLFSNDLFHLVVNTQTQRQPRVDAGCDAPDVASSDEPAVTGNLGVRRVFAQGAHEQLAHSGDHGFSSAWLLDQG